MNGLIIYFNNDRDHVPACHGSSLIAWNTTSPRSRSCRYVPWIKVSDNPWQRGYWCSHLL